MSQGKKSLTLWCDVCGHEAPHRVIPWQSVDDEESQDNAWFLKSKRIFNDELNDYYVRTGYARGRKCDDCGQKRLTIELDANIIVRLLRLEAKLDGHQQGLKKIEGLRREISAVLKEMKSG